MSYALCQAVGRYTRLHANTAGIASTPVAGLFLVRGGRPGALEHAIIRPLLCLVLQGGKTVTIGPRTFHFAAGDSMIVAADVPTVSRIREASTGHPYLAVALDLDPTIIAELDMATRAGEPSEEPAPDDVDARLRDAVWRLVRLLEQPSSLAVLGPSLVREIHYWLLQGRQGPAIRHLGLPESRVRRIGRAVALLHKHYARALTIDELADAAGMSRSAFHRHFRAVTSLSPLQFQKQLRLIEARRLLISEGKSASRAAFEVGYASVSQFTREYARLHGRPPVRDRNAVAEQGDATSASR